MVFIDATRFRKWGGVIVYSMFIVVIVALVYGTIMERVNAIAVDVQYKDYKGMDGKFTYKLPEKWGVKEQKFEGDEILYHSDFNSDDNKIRGYVQVWNLNMPLINFIEEGKMAPSDIMSFKFYTVEPIKIDGRDGYLLQYSRKQEGNKFTRAFEVFIKDRDNTFHRFTFYMDEQIWKDENRPFFLNMAASSKLK